MKTGCEMIIDERARQEAVERYDAAHDDEHDRGELAVIAAELAINHTDARVHDIELVFDAGADPWGLMTKHGDDPIRCLVIAGALIAAEIDRLQREAARS